MKTVLGGIIFWQDKVLIAQRRHDKSQEYMWEFPGGKQETGESEEECLHRELWEELRLKVKIQQFFMENRFAYPQGEILLKTYLCHSLQPEINWMDSHEQTRWVDIAATADYTFAPADSPIVEELRRRQHDILTIMGASPHAE